MGPWVSSLSPPDARGDSSWEQSETLPRFYPWWFLWSSVHAGAELSSCSQCVKGGESPGWDPQRDREPPKLPGPTPAGGGRAEVYLRGQIQRKEPRVFLFFLNSLIGNANFNHLLRCSVQEAAPLGLGLLPWDPRSRDGALLGSLCPLSLPSPFPGQG